MVEKTRGIDGNLAAAIFEKAADAMLLFNTAGRCVGANPAACRLLTRTREELTQTDMWKMTPRSFRSGARGTWEQFLKAGQQTGEFIFSTGTKGGRIAVEYRGVAHILPDVHLWVLHDITASKDVEREILETGEADLRRIGQDLDEYLSQELTGIAYFMRNLEEKLSAKRSAEGTDVRELSGMLNRAIARAREVSAGLLPVSPEPHGLCLALEGLALAVTDNFHVHCAFECERPVLVQPDVAIQLFRMARVAVEDAARRAEPQNIWIGLSRAKESVTLTVKDDGRLLGPVQQATGGENEPRALQIIRHRAALLGATVQVTSGGRFGSVLTVICRAEEPAAILRNE